jgi:hypothetical protein
MLATVGQLPNSPSRNSPTVFVAEYGLKRQQIIKYQSDIPPVIQPAHAYSKMQQ